MFERTPGNRRQWLRASAERLLMPELAKMGFRRVKLKYGNELDREAASSMPFGVHYAERNGKNIQLEIDTIRPIGPPEIRITFGEVPPGNAEYIPIDWQVSDTYTLYQSASCQTPFRLSWWSERRAKAVDYDKLILNVIEKLPQIDHLLDYGHKGPNIRSWPGSGEFTGYKDKQ